MGACGARSVPSGFVGGGAVSSECLRLGLANEIRYSILPILSGDGIRFFEKLDKDVLFHLTEAKAYKSGTVALCYEVRGHHEGSYNVKALQRSKRPSVEPRVIPSGKGTPRHDTLSVRGILRLLP